MRQRTSARYGDIFSRPTVDARAMGPSAAPSRRTPMASLFTNRLAILTVSKDYDER